MKKFTALLLCFLLVFGSVSSVFAANSNDSKGTTIRLVKTDGTVSVNDAAGSEVSFIKDMKLYNGYQVATKEKSYAYISLDTTKALKLDASTSVEVRKSGKKLEILLNEGSIFFNVDEKMSADETLNIRTNTMVTGITGTAGEMGVNELKLISGSVSIQLAGGQSVTLESGNSIVATEKEGDLGEIAFKEPIEELTELSGFALEYIKETPALQERLEENFSAEQIEAAVDAADEILAADEKQAEEEAAKAAEEAALQDNGIFTLNADGTVAVASSVEAEELFADAVVPTETSTSSGDSGSGSGSGSDPDPVDPPATTYEYTIQIAGLTYGSDYTMSEDCEWTDNGDGSFCFSATDANLNPSGLHLKFEGTGFLVVDENGNDMGLQDDNTLVLDYRLSTGASGTDTYTLAKQTIPTYAYTVSMILSDYSELTDVISSETDIDGWEKETAEDGTWNGGFSLTSAETTLDVNVVIPQHADYAGLSTLTVKTRAEGVIVGAKESTENGEVIYCYTASLENETYSIPLHLISGTAQDALLTVDVPTLNTYSVTLRDFPSTMTASIDSGWSSSTETTSEGIPYVVLTSASTYASSVTVNLATEGLTSEYPGLSVLNAKATYGDGSMDGFSFTLGNNKFSTSFELTAAAPDVSISLAAPYKIIFAPDDGVFTNTRRSITSKTDGCSPVELIRTNYDDGTYSETMRCFYSPDPMLDLATTTEQVILHFEIFYTELVDGSYVNATEMSYDLAGIHDSDIFTPDSNGAFDFTFDVIDVKKRLTNAFDPAASIQFYLFPYGN